MTGRVRDLLSAGHRNSVTNSVRNFASADFRNHSSAANGLLNCAWNPTLAADRATWARTAYGLRATWVAGIRNTLLDHWTGNCLRVGFPTTAADVNSLCVRYRTECRVAAVAVASLSFSLVSCVAAITVASVVNRLAGCVTLISVARLVDRLADVVANVAVARLVARLANVTGHSAVTGFHNRLAHVALNSAVTGFVHRLADCVTFVSVTGLVNISHAANGNCFCAAVDDHSHALALLLFPHDFTYRLVLDAASTLGTCEVSASVTSTGWTALIASKP